MREQDVIEAQLEVELGWRYTPQMRHGFKMEKLWNKLVEARHKLLMEEVDIKLREDRDIDRIDEVNDALLARMVKAVDECDDDEYRDILNGTRGSLSFLQHDKGSFRLCEHRCTCGNETNIPCQWLSRGEKCQSVYCENYSRRNAP